MFDELINALKNAEACIVALVAANKEKDAAQMDFDNSKRILESKNASVDAAFSSTLEAFTAIEEQEAESFGAPKLKG